MARPKVCSIFVALLGLVAFAGCGGSGHPLQTVRSAATNTLSLTAESTLSLTGARLFGDASGTIIGRTQFSFPKGLGYGGLVVPARGARASGNAYLVFQPTKLWIKPVANTGLPKGDLWISADFTDARSAGTTTPSLALVLESMNPQLLLTEIATGAVAASSSGDRVVNHVPYTEYVVSVDLQRALAAAGKTGALRTAMKQELAALPTGRAPLIRVVARIDGNGRLAQLQASPPGSNLGTVQMTLWRFGNTIPLSLPLTSQTADIASLPRAHHSDAAAWVFTGE